MNRQSFKPGDEVLLSTQGADSDTWFKVLHETPSGVIVGWMQAGLVVKGSAVVIKEKDYLRIKEHRPA